MKKKTAKATETVSDERLAHYMGGRYGQRTATFERYAEAIRACSDIAYLGKTVSEIARDFGHQPETFRMMMKRHYMEVLNERERLRQLLGLNKLPPRGVSETTRQKYEPNLQLLRTTDITVREAAEKTGVSLASLQQHIIFYHKDLARQRLMRRVEQLDQPSKQGRVTGAGRLAGPRGTAEEYYREAVTMLAEHPEMTVRQVATQTGVGEHNLSCYLCRWHRDILQQREVWRRQQTAHRQQERLKPNRFERAALQYQPALPLLEQGMTYQEAARQTGLDSSRLQWWVRHHRPDLHEREHESRWVTLPDGTRLMRNNFLHYQKAAREYCQTDEPLNYIVRRHGFSETNFRRFLQAAYPEAVERRRKPIRP